MALKPVIDNTDGLDEALKSLYTETNGVYILDLDHEALDKHPHVTGLVTANKTNAEKAQTRQAKIEELQSQIAAFPQDFDAEKWAKLKDGKPDEAAQIKLRQEYEAKISELEGKLTATQEAARKNAIERDLVQHLTAVGVTNEGLMRGALSMLSPEVKIGEDANPYVETDMGPLSLTERVKRFAAGEGKAFVDPGRGGGAKGGNGNGAPVTKETFAAMGDKERTELFRTDPETFKRLTAA